ncbi:class I SAM-dependent methyltransferase [Mycobacterium branderi]|uniref:Methyltransferase n=1 Tax=Mycobacterium branderi TaxID=43348 RepID=A0A7I7W5U4_9MYCO|nr:class I SAM-dependent methyltransferase [Mycobacterium branderi]MCV7235671.1 class I SAM-dependent methyltransferase [Mycobacterium branderi]ORA37890.1 SAM-dependent methyltransferase [Mycobacterium branderi]BBZ12450.1 methyltransferase [Mycobacterium branderi]
MTNTGDDRRHWSRVAQDWVAWARTPDHDAFWAYRQSLAAFVGRGTGAALDVGCGEGRVSRELVTLGYRVTAADPVEAMVDAAADAHSAHSYVVAEANRLPFADASFDLVVAYNMLMDVDDLPGAVREIRRVMRSAGRLVVSVVHPFTDTDSYFDRRRFEGVEERDGLRMRFAGWSQPLEAYAAALTDAGLAITALREPIPDPAYEHLERWTRMPLFLWLEARPSSVARTRT